ncbi:MAG: hypothetical protein QXK12_01970 [Candidatus Nezhaarchaeales archaeon]
MEEKVLDVTSDFERCLIKALAIATREYNRSGDLNNAKVVGKNFIENWMQTILLSNLMVGLKINYREPDLSLIWGENEGKSTISARISVDIEAYGLRKLQITTGKNVHLKICNVSSDQNKYAVNFIITQSGIVRANDDEPIPNLSLNDCRITILDKNETVVGFSVYGLVYNGNGNYTLNLILPQEFAWRKPLKIVLTIATPEDGIVVKGWHLINETSSFNSGGEWSTLYIGQLNGTWSIAPRSFIKIAPTHKVPTVSDSTLIKLTSPELNETIPPLSEVVVFTLYADAAPKKGVVSVTVRFGYENSSGRYVFPAIPSDESNYQVIDDAAIISNVEDDWPWKIYFQTPLGCRSVPVGSKFWIEIMVNFERKNGVFFIYIKDTGQSAASNIKLFDLTT